MQKIFIVEDDVSIVNSLKNILSSEFSVASTLNFRAVVQEITDFHADLVLMDITLPYFNGFYWTTELRKASKVPIIFISSANDDMNQVMALSMGADDFVAKPFNLIVLKAKVQALLRRSYHFSASELLFAGYRLIDNELISTDAKVDLTTTETKILQTLFEYGTTVVPKDVLLAKLWENDEFIDANTLHVNMARLRKKVAVINFDKIHTVRGVGYVLG
ncbi:MULTISPECIES: response regulator transcription factor [Leuconostoc]|nr:MULTISPECIES: response regulator transcription factor [Leuconostoc]